MLPIAEPCSVFRPGAGSSFCDKCEKHVHDLSAMTERQAQRFLFAHAGKEICVAYRSTRDGTVLVRPEPRTLGVMLVALGLAACTGYAPDVQHPDDTCRDAQGYEIECRPRVGLIVPHEPVDGRVTEPVAAKPPVSPEPVDPVQPIALPPVDTEVTAGTMIYIPDVEATPESRESRREARRERRAARQG